MSDQPKLERIETLIKTGDFSVEQESANLIQLILSVGDQEDRDLMLERVAIALAKVGKYEKSQELLTEICGTYEKTEGFIEYASSLISSGRFEDAFIALNNARTSAHKAGREWQKAELLNRIARIFLSVHEKEKAIEILDQAVSIARHCEETPDVQDSVDCSSVLWDISQTLTDMGERQKAIEIASSIKSPGKRSNAIEMLSRK